MKDRIDVRESILHNDVGSDDWEEFGKQSG